MNKIVFIASLILLSAAISCNGKKDPLLLLPIQDAATSASAAVPAQDLVPASTGDASGGGNVVAVVGDSSNSGGSSDSTGGSSDSGSTGGSSGSDSSGSGSSDGSSGSGSTGSSGSGSSGGSSGSGSSDGSSGSGSTGSSGSGSSDSGSAGSSGSGSSGGSSGGTLTKLVYKASEYTHIEGSWLKDGYVMITSQGTGPLGFSLKNLKSGRYRVTVTAGPWSVKGEEWPLPEGFKEYKVLASADGNASTITVPAAGTSDDKDKDGKDSKDKSGKDKSGKDKSGKSDDDHEEGGVSMQSGTTELNVTSGDAILLLAFGNPTCGACASESGKTTICHYPPGNPANKHSITVGNSAVSAHEKHGDTVGPCSGTCANLALGTITVERIGDASALSGFISGSKTKRNLAIAGITLAIAAAGLITINIYGRRRKEEV